jgi:hypothetical protein
MVSVPPDTAALAGIAATAESSGAAGRYTLTVDSVHLLRLPELRLEQLAFADVLRDDELRGTLLKGQRMRRDVDVERRSKRYSLRRD